MKLNQLVAIVTGEKTKAREKITGLYKKVQRGELMQGISRQYNPLDEEGEKLPDEYKKIQFTAKEIGEEAQKVYSELWNLVISQDMANCKAVADVNVDGTVVLQNIPITSLIYLEKQLTDFHTFISKVPILDPTEDWEFDDAAGYYKSKLKQTVRTKKVPRNHIKAEATKEHPAQVELFMEDIQVGKWNTYLFSGAMQAQRKNEVLERIDKLKNAVKIAREEANSITVETVSVAKQIFEYLSAS